MNFNVPAWVVLLVAAISAPLTWLIRGASDRKIADGSVMEKQWKLFQDEIERLNLRVQTLEDRIMILEDEKSFFRDKMEEEKGKVLRFEAMNLGRGEGRQMAAAESAGIIRLPPNVDRK